MKKAKQKVRADEVKYALARRHYEDFFLTEVKNGSTWTNDNLLILDAIAIAKSWAKPCITGYEVKVDRSDFQNDHKWPTYMQYCHCFYFACPKGLISANEVDKEVGLVWYDEGYATNNLYTVKKAPYRKIEISRDMLYYILMSRIEEEKHPFFTNQREFIEAYVEDKIDRRTLGKFLSSKLINEVRTLEQEKTTLEQELKKAQRDAETYEELRKILLEFGIRVSSYSWGGWQNILRKSLQSSTPPDIQRMVDELAMISVRLQEMIRKPGGLNE